MSLSLSVTIPVFEIYRPAGDGFTVDTRDDVPDLLRSDLEEIMGRYLYLSWRSNYVVLAKIKADIDSFLRQRVIEGALWYDRTGDIWRYVIGSRT